MISLAGQRSIIIKTGLDLIGESPVDPTTGVTSFTGNTANIEDHGVDLTFHANNTFGAFRWNSILLFSYVRDKVTKYEQVQAAVNNYLEWVRSTHLLVVRCIQSMHCVGRGWIIRQAIRKVILTGRGKRQVQVTEDYNSILFSPDLSNLIYKGPAKSTLFWRLAKQSLSGGNGGCRAISFISWGTSSGGLRSTIQRCLVAFRRGTRIMTGAGGIRGMNCIRMYRRCPFRTCHPINHGIIFIKIRKCLIENGDLVRLQDVQLTYDLSRADHPKLPMEQIADLPVCE